MRDFKLNIQQSSGLVNINHPQPWGGHPCPASDAASLPCGPGDLDTLAAPVLPTPPCQYL